MYDIIGDVHGCGRELCDLLLKLGYEKHGQHHDRIEHVHHHKHHHHLEHTLFVHPRNRIPVFLGDLTDRGPASLQVISLVTALVSKRKAFYIPGNHCDKLYRWMIGHPVQITHGLETTVAEFRQTNKKDRERLKKAFLELFQQSSYYLLLDEGKLVVAHAGMKAGYIGRNDKEVRKFCLFGDITGEKDVDGFPIRRDWAKQYKGRRWIVYGHTPVLAPRQVNRTVNIDTGCVFGGALTALRYPEFEYVSVKSTMPFVPEKFRLDYPPSE